MVAFALLGGCTAYQTFREGQSRIAEGDTEAGLAKLRQASTLDPGNTDFRRAYFTQLETAQNTIFRDAEFALDVGAFGTARDGFAKVLRLDLANKRARDGVARVDVAAELKLKDAYRKVDELPFDFERRRMSVVVESGETNLLVSKGAVDEILQVASCCASRRMPPARSWAFIPASRRPTGCR